MLRQAIMKRVRLSNLANKIQNPIGIKNLKKQQNIVLKLSKKIERCYMVNLNSKTDSKNFLDKSKPIIFLRF